jgi:(2Fe-2S) ferredoxin
VTERTCYGEVTATVATPIVRQGPKGTAAEYSARSPDDATLAATYTVRGTCRAATRFSFTGRWEGRAAILLLPNALKTLDCSEGDSDARTMQKRANPAWAGQRRFGVTLIGLALAGSVAGGMTVVTERTCYGEVTATVATPIVRQGPKGTAAEYSAASGG